jgi:hypothetical protein
LEAAVQRFLTGILVVIVIGFSAWWGITNWGYEYYAAKGPCGTERVWFSMDEFDRILDEMERLRDTWNNASDPWPLVDPMTRRSQRLLDDVRLIDAPLCLRGVKEHMEIGLESLLAAFQAATQHKYISFDRGSSGEITNIYLAEHEMAEVEQCAPFCESIVFNNLFP